MTAPSTTSGGLPQLQAEAFLDNVLEAARWFKPVALSALSRLTLAAPDLQQLRTSCSSRKIKLLNQTAFNTFFPSYS
jgi:hypothetical protein